MNRKKIRLFIFSFLFSIFFMGISVYAESPSVELSGLHVYLGNPNFSAAATLEGEAEKIDDTTYYIEVPGGKNGVNGKHWMRITGSRVSPSAEVAFVEAADEENAMGKDYSISYGESFFTKYKIPVPEKGNPFVSTARGMAMMNKIPVVSQGTSVFKITVTDGGLSKDYYLYVSVKVADGGGYLPDKMTLLNGEDGTALTKEQGGRELNLAELEYGSFGVSPGSDKIVIPDEINSIRLQLHREDLFSHVSMSPDNPGIYYKGGGPYDANDLKVSANFGPWSKVYANGKSTEIKLQKGLNVIRLIGKSQTLKKSSNSRMTSCVLFLYRQGDNSYEKPVGTSTKLKSVSVYQGALSKASAKEIASAKKEKDPSYDFNRPDELLAAADCSDMSKLKVALYSPSPCIYLWLEPEDPDAVVSIAGSEEERGGYFVQLDHENQDAVPIQVTPADGNTENAEFHYLPIQWQVTDSSLADLTVEGGTLSESSGKEAAYSKEIKDYYLIPDRFDEPLKITYEEGADSDVAVYENRQSAQHQVQAEDHTLTVDPAKIHKVIFQVTAKDGTSNTYTVAIKRQPLPDEAYTASKEKAQGILGKITDGWKRKKGVHMDKDYWDVFAMAGAKESLDGYFIYDVTKHLCRQGTDYSAVILELIMAGENPYDFAGHNYVQELLDYKKENGNYGPYACSIWSLYALDAAGVYDEDLVRTVARQADSKTFDLDMKSWALAAIQNHLKDQLDGVNIEAVSAIATEYMKGRQDGSGPIEGTFEHLSYKNSNLYTHACVIMGLTAAGIDLEDEEWKINETLPLDVFEQRLMPDGMLNDPSHGKSYNRQPMIALGGVINQTNVWMDQALTVGKIKALLAAAETCKNNPAYGKKIQEQAIALQNKLDRLEDTADQSIAYGLGEPYYALYDLVGKVKEEWKPVTFMGTEDEKNTVDKLINEIDAIGTDYSAKINDIIRLKKTYDELSTDAAQLVKLQHYVSNRDVLLEASAQAESINARVGALIAAIDALPSAPSLADEGQVNALRAEYAALPAAQQAMVANAGRLSTLYSAILKLKDVVSQIEALPGVDAVDPKDTAVMEQVTAAQEAYNALSDAEKAQITNSAKLTEILKRIDNLNAAAPVIEQIAAIGEITEQNWKEKEALVLIARGSYNKLQSSQKALVTNYNLLESAEAVLSSFRGGKEFSQIITMIQKLWFTDSASGEQAAGPLTLTEENNGIAVNDIWTPQWRDYVINLRGMVDGLEEAQKASVVNLADLEKAEAYIRNLQVSNVAGMLTGLPDASAIGQTPLTPKQISDIAAAKAAYDELTAEEKELLKADPANAALAANLELAANAAEADALYLPAYLQGYVQKLERLYIQFKEKPVLRTELTAVQRALDQYNGYPENYKAALAELSGKPGDIDTAAVDMLSHLQRKAEQTQKDISDAAEADKKIAELPMDITDDNAASVEEAVAAIEKILETMTEEARSYLRNTDKLNTVKQLLDHYQAERAPQIEKFQKGILDGLTAKASSYNSVKVSWNAYENADSYHVYRKTANGKWKKLAAVSTLHYTDKTAQPKTVYYYTVKAGSSKWGEAVYSSYETEGVKAVTALGKAVLKKAKPAAGGRSAKLTWSKTAGASGYVISRASSAGGRYKNVKTISNGSKLSYTDRKLAPGRTYFYKVRAYRQVKGKKVFGADSNVKSVQVKPGTVKGFRAVRAGSGVELEWKAVKGVTGYRVYRASSKKGIYQAIGTSKKTSYRDGKTATGRTYYYKVRAYKKVNGKNVYGNYSKAKKTTVK